MSGILLCGDSLELMRSVPAESVSMVFADPNFNTDYLYGGHCLDRVDYNEYKEWTATWLERCYRVLERTGSIYVCQGDEYAAETKLALHDAGFHFRNWIIWHYTFGENQRKKFSRCKTHILYFVKDEKNFCTNFSAVAIPSARQTVYNDKRAKEGGKMPDDVWEYSRVCGTFKESQGYTTQMPEALVERAILFSSNPGETVLDPFGGTFTTAAVAARLGREWWSADLSSEQVKKGKKRVEQAAKARTT